MISHSDPINSIIQTDGAMTFDDTTSNTSATHTNTIGSTYIALALASSRAVTHDWRSTSLAALMWNVCVPPLVMTNVHESTVWMRAPCSEMVPRHVCVISAWFLFAEWFGRTRV